MKTYRLQVDTYKKSEMIDLTDKIRTFVKDSKVEHGYVLLFVPHTTAGITLNENTDPDVRSDLLFGLNKNFPVLEEYKHFEGNSDAHLKSSLVGVSQTVLIENRDLVLGVWQAIYFCEFDGPKTRRVLIQIHSEEK